MIWLGAQEKYSASEFLEISPNSPSPIDEIINFSVNSHNLGDNIVGFLSQIGWTENDGTSPNKTIDFERIFVNVDTNSGNLEMISHLHSKMAHRDVVMEKVFEYLSN